MTHALYLRTTNDRNGNPRRGWLISSHGLDLEAFIDEDHSGARDCLHEGLEKLAATHEHLARLSGWTTPYVNDLGINVSPGEFRRIRGLARARKTLV